MSKHVLRINHTDGEETAEITLDGKFVQRVDHDQHGWAGMEAAIETAEAIAKICGWEVEEAYGGADEEDGDE